MMRKKVRGIFALIVGIAVIGLWIMLLSTGQVPELETEPIEIVLHIIAELAMAVGLFIAGVMILMGKKFSGRLFLVADGMMIYSVINASGYYLQRGDYIMPGMFSVLLILGICMGVWGE